MYSLGYALQDSQASLNTSSLGRFVTATFPAPNEGMPAEPPKGDAAAASNIEPGAYGACFACSMSSS